MTIKLFIIVYFYKNENKSFDKFMTNSSDKLYQDEVIDIMRNGGTKINAHDKCCVVILAFFL